MNPINNEKAPWNPAAPKKAGSYLITDGIRVTRARFDGKDWVDKQLSAIIGWRNLHIPKGKK